MSIPAHPFPEHPSRRARSLAVWIILDLVLLIWAGVWTVWRTSASVPAQRRLASPTR